MSIVESLRNAKNPAFLLPEDRMTVILHNHNQLVHPTSNHVTKMETSFGQKNYLSFFAKHQKQTFLKVHQTEHFNQPIEQKNKKQKKVELTKMTHRNAFRKLVLCANWLQPNKRLRINFLRENISPSRFREGNVSAFICKTPTESFERHNARCSHLLFQNIPNIVFSSERSVLFAKVLIIKITLPASGRLQIW